MYDVLRAALPEFLGSLGAALTLAAGTWTARKLRTRFRSRVVPPVVSSEAVDGAAASPVRLSE
ncbi:hypothetical protein [Streptomyces olivaceiscleroticus]|uniref:Uncharacterized protein n=1 Tax=Streptomyces olivaceiscleroticus TaxID=68245 RepID=A0ABN0ZMM4_9ACTN